MKEKKRTKELEFQKDYDELQRVANMIDVKEVEYKEKLEELENEKVEFQRQVYYSLYHLILYLKHNLHWQCRYQALSYDSSLKRKSEELIALVHEFQQFKDYVSSSMIETYQLQALEEEYRRETVPRAEFHQLSEKLSLLRSECRLNLVSKEEFESILRERDEVFNDNRAHQNRIQELLKEKKMLEEKSMESSVLIESLEGQVRVVVYSHLIHMHTPTVLAFLISFFCCILYWWKIDAQKGSIEKVRLENINLKKEVDQLKGILEDGMILVDNISRQLEIMCFILYLTGGPVAEKLRNENENIKFSLRKAQSGEETLRSQLIISENSLAKSHNAEKEIGIRVLNFLSVLSHILPSSSLIIGQSIIWFLTFLLIFYSSLYAQIICYHHLRYQDSAKLHIKICKLITLIYLPAIICDGQD